MALDPAFAPLLAHLASAPAPAADADPVAAARAGTTAMFAHPGAPDLAVRDRTIEGPDANALAVRIYRPHGSADTVLPILVFFHGGGFVAGGLDSHDGTCRELTAATGCVTVAVDYRLAPEHRFPAGFDDCVAALDWSVANAPEIGGDPARVAICGDSAGGNLCAAVALASRDRGGPDLVAQVLIYPVTDPSCATRSMNANGAGYLLTADSMKWMWSNYLGSPADATNAYAAPAAAADVSGLPPALVITAEYDPLRDEGEAYAARMAGAGVPVVQSRYGGQIHGFFSMYPMAPQAAVATAEVARFLRGAFGSAAPSA